MDQCGDYKSVLNETDSATAVTPQKPRDAPQGVGINDLIPKLKPLIHLQHNSQATTDRWRSFPFFQLLTHPNLGPVFVP